MNYTKKSVFGACETNGITYFLLLNGRMFLTHKAEADETLGNIISINEGFYA